MEQTTRVKRWAAWLLVLVLFIGLTPINPVAKAEGLTAAQINLLSQSNGIIEEDELVSVIVQLKEKTINYKNLNTMSAKQTRIKTAEVKQESVQAKIKSKGIDFKLGFTYSLVLNGFSGETTLANAMKIAALPEVADVSIATEFDAPQPVDEPKMKTSAGMVSAASAWELGFEGQGQLIAVIDSGADPDHQDFVLTDASKAKYPTVASMNQAISQLGLIGKAFNEKVIYGFNYKDGNSGIKEISKSSGMHGMHVAGTTAANGNPDQGGVRGIAPEAQLLVMRVFGEAGGGTNSTFYTKAIDDAVKLGADSLNMSLGSPAGVIGNIDNALSTAIQKAGEIGALVNVAAGNEGYFGESFALPKADAPDYGIVATPSIAPMAMSVASMNNDFIQMISIELGDGTKIPYKLSGTLKPKYGETYEMVYLGLGKKEDMVGKDVAGKVALIERGEINFTDKIANAHEAGAVIAVIFNNAAGGDEYVAMVTDGAKIPAASITRTNGLKLRDNPQTMTFSDELISGKSAIGGEMSGFSNWGLSNEQNMKPEITAPGGDIYSTLNDNTYGGMSGTSMATPHVAGGVSIINERVKKDFPAIQGMDRYGFIKNLMMSTATPHIDLGVKVPTSPRKQGAGVMNLAGAATSNVIAVDPESGLSQINLKNIEDNFSLKVNLINKGTEAVTYDYSATLQTDAVKDGRFLLKPRLLKTISGGQVTVEGNSEKEVTLNIDASAYTEELSKLMPNGYYLEGFVTFTSTSDVAPELSVPYVGFKGIWNEIPVLEKSIYDHKEGEKPFYFDNGTNDFTHFFSKVDSKIVVNGYDKNKTPMYDKNRLVVSPNGDGKLDDITFRGTFLRNYTEVQLSVHKPGEEAALYKSFDWKSLGKKNHFSGNNTWEKSSTASSWYWRGLNSNYGKVADGTYDLKVSAKPYIAGAKTQEMVFPVIVDTQAPGLKNVVFNEETRLLTFTAFDLISDVQSVEVELSSGTKIKPDANGAYLIPAGVNLKDVKITVTDLGYNQFSDNAENALIPVYFGSIVVGASTSDGSRIPNYKAVVKNAKGEVQNTLNGMEYGTYTVEATEIEKGYFTDKSSYTVTLTEEEPMAKVNFVFTKPDIPTGALTVSMKFQGGTYPEEVKLVATDSKGVKYNLEKDSYVSYWYVADVPYETYTVSFESIAEGWIASPETSTVKVDSAYPTIINMTLAKGTGGKILPQAVAEDGIDVSNIKFAAFDFYGEDIDLSKPLPNGEYTVYPLTIPEGAYVVPQYHEVEITDNINEVKPVFNFKKTNGLTGSVAIETIKAKDSYPNLDVTYSVEDFYGNEMADWDNLPLGTYYIKVKEYPMAYSYTPASKEIKVFPESLDHTAKFTFTKLTDTGRKGGLYISVNDPSYSYRQNITFEIKDEAGEITTLVYDRLSFSNKVELPFGVYEVRATDIADGYYIDPEVLIQAHKSTYSYFDFDLKKGQRPVESGKIVGVEKFQDMTVDLGTLASDIALPKKAEVTLNDETKESVSVVWDLKGSDYDGSKAGTYTFTGTLDLTDKNFTNPDGLTVTQKVIVKSEGAGPKIGTLDLYILGAYGYSGGTITLELKNEAGQITNYDYDTKKYTHLVDLPYGTYEIKAKGLLDGYYLEPEVTTVVLDTATKPVTLSLKKGQVADPTSGTIDLYVSGAYGYPGGKITFEFKDEKAKVTTYEYDTSKFSHLVTLPYGTYEIKAKDLKDGYYLEPEVMTVILNAPTKFASFTLKKGAVALNVTAVEKFESMTVEYGTAVEDLNLPKKAKITLSNKTEVEVPVIWDLKAAAYDGTKAGSYIFTGSLDLTGKNITNPNDLKASQEVIVEPKPPVAIHWAQSYNSQIIAEETAWESLTLPTKANVILKDMTKMSLKVEWNKDNYDETYIGKQTIVGSLVLPEDGMVLNPKGLTVTIDLITENTERIFGKDRYETALKISRRTFEESDTVILINGEALADSPLASPLSIVLDAPILMIERDRMSPDVEAEIERLGAENIILIGGELVIAKSVEQDLVGKEYAVERFGGSTRHKTSQLIDAKIRSITGVTDKAVITNGTATYDALVMGKAAGDLGVGILYNDGKSNEMIQENLKQVESVVLLGGTLVESQGVEDELKAAGITVDRISGSTRYSTAVAVANKFYPTADRMIIANGIKPYDGTASAPLSARYNAPLLLTDAKVLSPEVQLFMRGRNLTKVYILGGELSVSEPVKDAIIMLLY